jgi:hypothetical protein
MNKAQLRLFQTLIHQYIALPARRHHLFKALLRAACWGTMPKALTVFQKLKS